MGMVVMMFMSTISAAGGLAGGTMVIPIFKIFFNFTQRESVALANTYIFISTLT